MRAENVFILLIFCFLFYPRNSPFQFHCLLHGFHEQIKKKSMCVCVWAQTILLVLLYVFKYIRKKEKVLFVLLKTRCDARAVNTLLSCFFLGDGLAARDADR